MLDERELKVLREIRHILDERTPTLRQQYAKAAMQTLLDKWTGERPLDTAEDAFAIADAMIEVQEEGKAP